MIPSKIYRYRSLSVYTLKEIYFEQVYFPDLNKLNDPIDSNLIEYTIKDILHNCSSNDRVLLDNIFGLEKRIVCFTDSYDNHLMWSHYGDNHQGICIEYDYNKLLSQNKIDLQLYPVIYTDNIQNIIKNKKCDTKILSLVNFMKSTCWKYEKEWRFMLTNKNYDYITNEYCKKLPINSIIFGCRCFDQLTPEKQMIKKMIIDLANKYGINMYNLYIGKYPIDGNKLQFKICQYT